MRDAIVRPHAFTTTIAIVALAIVVGAPIASLAHMAIDVGPLAIVRALTTPNAVHALAMSAALAFVAVVVNGAFGVATALVLVRSKARVAHVLDVLVDVPLATAPVITGLAFLLLFGRNGMFASTHIAFAPPGLALATLFVTLPFCAREAAYALREVGDVEEQAAATLGASSARTLFLVTLPKIAPAIGAGVSLTAARALGEFGAVLVVGGAVSGRTETATTLVYAALEQRDDATLAGTSLLLAAASALLLTLVVRLKRGLR